MSTQKIELIGTSQGRALRLISLLGLALALSGCAPTPQETAPNEAQALVGSMVYVRAKNGLCFGVSTTARLDTGGKLSQTNQVVHVPCAAAGL